MVTQINDDLVNNANAIEADLSFNVDEVQTSSIMDFLVIVAATVTLKMTLLLTLQP